MSDFISRNKQDWDELEQLVARARKTTRHMTPEELSRLDILYRRTTVHLAQVATRTSDAKLLRYLNDLTASAHSVIYLPPKQPLWKGFGFFVLVGFARAIARTWRFHAVSAALILGGGFVGYFASMHDPVAAYALMPKMPGDVRLPGASGERLQEALRSGRDEGQGMKFLFASFLFSNNLKVGILAMALGVLVGVPTVMLLVYNGMMLGAFTAMHHKAGIYADYWAWILPHGITEIGAIVLCGGVGLLLGKSVINPGLKTRSENFRLAGIEAGRMVFGVAGMLFLAAIIESYLRQSHLSLSGRFAFAAATGVFWTVYIAHGFLAEKLAKHPKVQKT